MTSQQTIPNVTIGLDLGDKISCICEIDASGQVVKRATIASTPSAIERYFGGVHRAGWRWKSARTRRGCRVS